MTAETNLFAVLLASVNDLQPGLIGQALSSYKKVPFQDGVQEAKSCWGIVGENLKEDDAKELIASLVAQKVNAVIVPQSQMREIPSSVTLAHVNLTDDGLTGLDGHGGQRSVLWKQLRVVGAAGITSTESKIVQKKEGPTPAQKAVSMGIMMATGLPIHIGGKKRTVEKRISSTEISFLLALVTDGPAALFEIQADSINYAALKERMLHNAMGNFKLVLSDILAKAPHARRGKGTSILLLNEPVSKMGYDSSRNLEKECRWLFSLGI